MRHSATIPLQQLPFGKEQLLHWAAKHDVFLFLDSNGHQSTLVKNEWTVLVAAGAVETMALSAGNAFESLKAWQTRVPDWLFGGLGYDLKNEVEQLSSGHPDAIGLPDLLFFRPETVVGIRGEVLEIHSLLSSPDAILDAIKNARPLPREEMPLPTPQPRIAEAEYMKQVDRIREHIIEGDLYELNFCQEFFAKQARMDPMAVWEKLNLLARAPMSAFFRWHDRYVLSASPERFLKKEGQKLISQPIKGTRRRAGENDEAMRQDLATSVKDRAENVMIVDLVRNDLARSCVPGSVRVDELFGIYTFDTVHQMISTVSGQLKPTVHPIDALRHAFPPGSMTGAPKVMAMELIEQYEQTRRGFYAGALGYFDPSGDFDFNVLIRSIFYHAGAPYISFQVGGAIVFDSLPEAELDECLVKAEAMFGALR